MNPNLGYDQQQEIDTPRTLLDFHNILCGPFNEEININYETSSSERPDFRNGTTWYVDDIPGSGPDNPPEDFTRLKDAVYHADFGDTIYVHNGIYYDYIRIEKSLIIKGENKSNTIIYGNGLFAYSMIKIIHVDFVTLMNFSFHNGSGLYLAYSSNSTIIDNIFHSNGIYVVGNHVNHWNCHIINNNTLHGKTIRYYKNQQQLTIPDDTGQLIIGNCSHSLITNLNICHARNGLLSGFSKNITIINNNFSYCDESSIDLRYSSGFIIKNNTLSNNRYGISIQLYSSNNTIESNHIIDKKDDKRIGIGIGVNWYASNNSIQNNLIEHTDIGIYFQITSQNRAIDNIIKNNQKGIFIFAEVTNISIINNHIEQNANSGIYLYGTLHNFIHNNSIKNNLNGILIENSNFNNIIGNNCSFNRIDGIGLIYGSCHNIIKKNRCNDNMKGIVIRSSTLIKDFILVTNYLCFNNIIKENICEKNHQGILLNKGFSNTINDNQMSYNGIGIYLYSSSMNSIKNNSIQLNSHKGLALRSNSILNSICYNQIGPWNYQGIYIEKSSYNRIAWNNISLNNDDGIGLLNTIGNKIHFNNFIENTNYDIEGLLCFDNARFNHWDGQRFPYIRNKIYVGGIILVHPCIKKQIKIY